MSTRYQHQRGMITLDIVIALALLVIAMTTVLPLLAGNQSTVLSSQTNQEALYKATTLIENTKTLAHLDFDLVNSVSPTTDGIYTTSLTVTPKDLFTKEVKAIVSWKGDHNQNLQVHLSTIITNPQAIDGGNTCSSVLTGDWTHPSSTTYSLASIIGNTSASLPISDIDIFNGKIYITLSNTTNALSPTFFVLDASNPNQTPTLVWSLDNDPLKTTGLHAVHTATNYVYVANDNNAVQLQVIDLNSHSVVANVKIPGVTGTNSQAVGKSIFYANGVVYLGLSKTANGPEFNIIDVGGLHKGGSPTHPVYVNGLSMGADINQITVKGNRAYVTTSGVPELRVIDVSNP